MHQDPKEPGSFKTVQQYTTGGKQLLPHVIEDTILTGVGKENVCIPRIPIIPSDLPFEFKILQFPIKLSYAMTINKTQGQSLRITGLELMSPCFPMASSSLDVPELSQHTICLYLCQTTRQQTWCTKTKCSIVALIFCLLYDLYFIYIYISI